MLKPKKTQGKFYAQKYWNRRRPQATLTYKSIEIGEDPWQIQHTKQLNLGIGPPGKFKTKKYWGKMVGLWKAKLQILHTKVLKQEKTPGKFFAQNLSKVLKVLKQTTFWLLLVLVLQHTKVLKQDEIRPNLPKQILHTKMLKQKAYNQIVHVHKSTNTADQAPRQILHKSIDAGA